MTTLNCSAYPNGTALSGADAAWTGAGASVTIEGGVLTDSTWVSKYAVWESGAAGGAQKSVITIPAGQAYYSPNALVRATSSGSQGYAAVLNSATTVQLYRCPAGGSWSWVSSAAAGVDNAVAAVDLGIEVSAGNIVTVTINGAPVITLDDSATPVTGGYRGLVIGGAGGTNTIAAWTDGAAAAPSITTQPASVVGPAGAATTLHCVATGTGAIEYALQQYVGAAWQTVDTNSGGAFAVDLPASGYVRYRVVVTDDNGEATSDVVTLTAALAASLLADLRSHLMDAGFALRSLVFDGAPPSALVDDVLLAEMGAVAGVSGTLAVTEGAADAFAAQGAVDVAGAAAVTESADHAVVAGAVVIAGALAVTEPADAALQAQGNTIVGAALAVTDAPDVLDADGVVIVGAVLAVTEAADAVSGSGALLIEGDCASTEQPDVMQGAGDVVVSVQLSATDAPDTIVVDGAVIVGATLDAVDTADQAHAEGAALVAGVLAVIEAADALHSWGTVGAEGSVGYLAALESHDVAAAAGAVLVAGTAHATEQPDVASIVGAATAAGALAVTEAARDVLSGTIAVAVQGALASAESADAFAADGTVQTGNQIVGVLVLQEAPDAAHAVGAVLVLGTLAATETADRVSAAGTSEGPAMPTYADDILFLAPRIVERLRAQVPALREVLQFDSVDLDKGPRQTPAAIVLFDREILPAGEDAKRLVKQIVRQRWLVLVAVRSAEQQPGRYGRTAGTYIAGCVQALQGWTPAGTTRPLVRVTPPAPSYGKDTSYFPLAFEQQLVTP